jgi:hypothetical protein
MPKLKTNKTQIDCQESSFAVCDTDHSIVFEMAVTQRTIEFRVESSDEPVLQLRKNGEIYVRGTLCDSDKEIYTAFREWLRPICP